MFRKTIAKAVIGAIALSSFATQAANINNVEFYGGLQGALKLADPDSVNHTHFGEIPWNQMLPSKQSDFTNFAGTVGVALNPARTFGIPLSFEFLGQTFSHPKAAQYSTPVMPESGEEKVGDTANKVIDAANDVTWFHATFGGIQVKTNFAMGEALDGVFGVGAGRLAIGDEWTFGLPVHAGVQYHISDHVYMPVNLQYIGNPFKQADTMLNNWTLNVGFHYHL